MQSKYADHIAACNAMAQHSPAGLVRAGLFVLATIQQQLETVPTILRDFETAGSRSPFAFGSKRAGIEFLQDNGRQLWRDAAACRDSVELQLLFLNVPGLALVKTGFLCQMYNGTVGCLDLHNIARHNVPDSIVRPFNVSKVKPVTAERRVSTYQEHCEGIGGSEFLWRTWCQHIAALRPGNWTNGLEVSQLHVECMSGRERGAMSGLQSGFEFAPKFETGLQ